MRTGVSFTVSATDRYRLEAVIADRNAPQKHVWRCRIVLGTADGLGTTAIMREAGVAKTAVWCWQKRFMAEGVDGLLRDKTRPSRIPSLGANVAERVVQFTLDESPGETTHWTADAMSRVAGISASAVRRIWKAHGLEPHRCRQFKLSTDPHFVEKLRDVVGLYVDPPAHAIVNAVEGFFARLARRRLKRGAFHSLVDLQATINRFVAEHNATDPKPFQWTADPDRIIAAVWRGHQALESIH